jgi:hypothetical protein
MIMEKDGGIIPEISRDSGFCRYFQDYIYIYIYIYKQLVRSLEIISKRNWTKCEAQFATVTSINYSNATRVQQYYQTFRIQST